MSYHEYHVSGDVVAKGYPFYALLMAAMRQADTDNLLRLQLAWPEVWAELQARYDAPGGLLASERTVKEQATTEKPNKPKIFIVAQEQAPEWTMGYALAEDGHCLASHCSSALTWVQHDMGLTSDWKHKQYDTHYPDGWQLIDLTGSREPQDNPEYAQALRRNKALAPQEAQ